MVSYQAFEVNRTLVVIWGEVSPADLLSVRSHLKAFGQRLGALPVYLAVTPPEAPPPSDEARKEMLATMGETSALTETLHLVLEAQGLRATALRSVVASMFLIAGNRKIFVHHTVEDALAKSALTPNEQAEVRRVIAERRKSAS